MSTQTNDSGSSKQDSDLAADVIRQKINSLYGKEPDAEEEVFVAEESSGHRSKHQQYMHDLTLSGRPLAEIQTAWHQYYQNLNDKEKHEVWQEFYSAHSKENTQPANHQPEATSHTKTHQEPKRKTGKKRLDSKRTSVGDLKQRIAKNVGTSKKLSRKQHLQSLIFGFSAGAAVLLILLFGFFNERFIAPFITPSKAVSNTPIIIDPNDTVAPAGQTVVIPKINVEVPVVYDVNSISEDAIQKGLERGVVHYSTTPNPGEKGNVVIVGHSSNNILNQGKYKFAFVLLNRLQPGDTIILTKDRTRYAYKVYEKRVVAPTDVSVLGTASKPNTVTLITCDPPGTSLNRLIVVAEQVSPNPSKNKASTAKKSESQAQIVPGNAPSLWNRLTNWLTGSSDE